MGDGLGFRRGQDAVRATSGQTMPDYAIKALTTATWPDFAALVERHNGVWGGCWCMGFHAKGEGWGTSAALNRGEKEALVRAGQAHAALVYEGDACVGWCQFGPPAELPRIKHQRAYRKGPVLLADWRITCFFVDKTRRGQGVAEAALKGALDLIARSGGGRVESFPEEVEGRKTAGAFLFNGEVGMFDRQGFQRLRKLGKDRWLVTREVLAQA